MKDILVAALAALVVFAAGAAWTHFQGGDMMHNSTMICAWVALAHACEAKSEVVKLKKR